LQLRQAVPQITMSIQEGKQPDDEPFISESRQPGRTALCPGIAVAPAAVHKPGPWSCWLVRGATSKALANVWPITLRDGIEHLINLVSFNLSGLIPRSLLRYCGGHEPLCTQES